jgi:hypothetical protein
VESFWRLPFWSRLAMGGRPCSGRIIEFRTPLFVRSPQPLGVATQRVHHTRTVRDGILDHVWVRDITGAITVQVIVQYIRIWDLLLYFALTKTPDHFIWKWTASGKFSRHQPTKRFSSVGCLSWEPCTSGRLRVLAGCASSVGLSCMVVVGRLIHFDVKS